MASPFRMPGIVLNWRRTSSTMSMAVLPAEPMVSELMRYRRQMPRRMNAMEEGSITFIVLRPTMEKYVENRTNDVTVPDDMAYALVVAFMVLPTESSCDSECTTCS